MTTDLITWLRGVLAEDERHAAKDLNLLNRATGGGDWTARHGYNMPESVIVAGDATVARLVAHVSGLPDGADDQHNHDALVVARMVKLARQRARRTLADVAAKRAVLDLHGGDGGHECPSHDDAWGNVTSFDQPCRTVRLLASAHRDRPGYRAEWGPA